MTIKAYLLKFSSWEINFPVININNGINGNQILPVSALHVPEKLTIKSIITNDIASWLNKLLILLIKFENIFFKLIIKTINIGIPAKIKKSYKL